MTGNLLYWALTVLQLVLAGFAFVNTEISGMLLFATTLFWQTIASAPIHVKE